MKISTNPPQHLSNYEVLDHFLTLKKDNDQLQTATESYTDRIQIESKQSVKLKSDAKPKNLPDQTAEEAKTVNEGARRGMCQEIIWVQDQVIKYLCSDFNTISRQTPSGVSQLARDLQRHGLAKAEVLQICNLAPTKPVELYCIIEQTDERFQPNPSARLAEIISDVQSTLLDSPHPALAQYATQTQTYDGGEHNAMEGMEEAMISQEFVHEPEWGAGHEEGVGEEVENDME